MTVHQEINAHLLAAERNPLKRAQHLIAATQHAEANGIPHFGRWNEPAIHARNAVIEQRAEEKRIKNREPKIIPTVAGTAPDARGEPAAPASICKAPAEGTPDPTTA